MRPVRQSGLFTSAPASSSTRTASVLPWMTASCAAVQPAPLPPPSMAVGCVVVGVVVACRRPSSSLRAQAPLA